MPVDVAEDVQKELTAEDLADIINKARQLMVLELEIGKLEDLVKQKQEEYKRLATETLPNLITEKGAPKKIPLANGYQLEVKDVFRASIPAESTIERANDEERPLLEARREEAFSWLKENKAGDIIKSELRIALGRGEAKLVKAIHKALSAIRIVEGKKKIKPVFNLTEREAVHPSTLAKYLREKLESGADVPYETFAIFKGTEAQIIAPKKSKEKSTAQ